MAKCPKCGSAVGAEEIVCSCGYDFSMNDCPQCENRFAENLSICPNCQYNIFGTKPTKKVKKTEVPSTFGRSVKVVGRLNKIQIPAAFEVSKWHEWEFKKPITDENMLEWAKKIRARAEQLGDKYTNCAIHYLADTHDNKELRKNAIKLLVLLGGDDSK